MKRRQFLKYLGGAPLIPFVPVVTSDSTYEWELWPEQVEKNRLLAGEIGEWKGVVVHKAWDKNLRVVPGYERYYGAVDNAKPQKPFNANKLG